MTEADGGVWWSFTTGAGNTDNVFEDSFED
jgi:hypothetical protein